MTNIPVTWTEYALWITIDAAWANQLLQFGFLNTATLYEPSGIFYDNVNFDVGVPTSVASGVSVNGHALLPASPNPSRGAAEIRFAVPSRKDVRIDVFDVAGRRVAQLLDGAVPGGRHRVVWSGLDATGQPVASGTYFYRMETEGFTETRKIVPVR